jgi:hypothetical protein
VALNVEFHLFQELIDQYTAVIVSDKTNHKILETIEIPEMIEVQDIPEMIEVQDIPEMIEVQDIPEMIEVQDIPVYCSDCFRQNKPQDSGSDRYSRDDRGSRYSRNDRGSRSSRDDFRSKKPKTDKFLKKQETFYSGGSEKFYNTIKEKLFEILGGKVCSGCGFKDERALGFSHISDGDTFDNVQRGGFASSFGKYISDPDLARNELKILCLNCNEVNKPVSTPERKTSGSSKKKKRFPR